MKRSTLALLAVGASGAAAGGFGAAIGRDLWKSTKKRPAAILALAVLACALVLPLIGGRNLTRGYPGHAGKGLLLGLPAILLGGALMLVIVETVGSGQEATFQLDAQDYLIAGSATCSAALLGMAWGALQRTGRYRRYAILRHNEAFLSQIGLVETGEEETTHYDSSGAPLRLIERTHDSLVFMAVGRRNRPPISGWTNKARWWVTLASSNSMNLAPMNSSLLHHGGNSSDPHWSRRWTD